MNENEIEKKKEYENFFKEFITEKPNYSEIRVAKREKNKLGEVGLYAGLYLLAYLFVLALCGGVQYLAICKGESSACGFDLTGLNTIIVTTSYVLTPIIAMIGFLSWKRQHNKQTISQLSKEAYELLGEQNLIAFNYPTYIRNCYKDDEVNNPLRRELLYGTANTYDKIRLICKITNNEKLEKLNESNKTAIYAMVINFGTRLSDGVCEQNAVTDCQNEYQTYSKVMSEIREELSDYILI